MSTPQEIGDRLVALCRANDEATALHELYHPDAVSVEAMTMPGMDSREMVGVDAIKGKHAWWESAMEVHSANVDGPYPHGDDRFGIIFEIDATDKSTGERQAMKEIAIYHVADGKIVREEFFYSS
jgi:ketosteroid isomerase-like protein